MQDDEYTPLPPSLIHVKVFVMYRHFNRESDRRRAHAMLEGTKNHLVADLNLVTFERIKKRE